MITTIILFAVGALFGLHILTHVLKSKPTPKVSVLLHGLLVVVALILTIIAAADNANGMLIGSLVLFVIAALGGFVMVYIDLGKKRNPPKGLAILHPILAAIGLVLLIIYAFGK